MAKKFDRNTFVLTIVFFIFCLPLILSFTRIGQEGSRQFSVYNEGWDGTSTLRENLENQGFEFHPIVSTLNTLTRLDTMGVLAIIGPTIFFDPTETAALAYFIMRGGSVLIADDFGRANDILGLVNSVIAPFVGSINASELGMDVLPLAGIRINNSLLMDAQNYYRSPVMPIIESFYELPGTPSMSGVSRVITSYPSAISFLSFDNETGDTKWVPAFSYQGIPIASGIAVSSRNSWLEKDVEKAKQGDYYPDEDEWQGVPFSIMVPLPLGAIGIGNILICSDPSIFINELMDLSSYDNSQLASNLFNWLDFNSTGIIYYDESHLSSASGARCALTIVDPFSYVRIYLRYIDSFTMFPLLAPLFPLITFLFLKSRYPKTKGASPLLLTKIRQYKSRSFFAAKMAWYLNYQQFDTAMEMLYKRLKRRFQKKFGITEDLDNQKIIELLQMHYSDELNIKSTEKLLEFIDSVIDRSKKITGEEFASLVLDIKTLEDLLAKPKE